MKQLVDSSDCILGLGVLDTDFNFAGMYNPDDPGEFCEASLDGRVIDAKRGGGAD